MKKIRALVTGGCGFIGSHLIRQLLISNNFELVQNFDLLTYSGHPENCADISDSRYSFTHGSINDKALLIKLIKIRLHRVLVSRFQNRILKFVRMKCFD